MPSYDFVRLALLPDQSQETRAAYQHDAWQLTEQLRRRGLTLRPAPGAHPSSVPNGEPEAIARYLIAFRDLIGATFEKAAVAWLEDTPGRRLVIGMGDIEIEAATADDFHRLFTQARMLDTGRLSGALSEVPLHARPQAHHHALLEEYHA
ncbi:hypothetical protein OVY01_18545 [Robbsia sp. Bb-Pol-6]|uniref:Uncharacterized protein n=1 Tax=Robbsia betulipollinis TaxID=2981849 RepID=A0ABT3ZTF4_9BURK|nr:hypothetical protein [Robbsia betulipollinis]MCY0389148.1 hypothetical protein [Robbsia betulipollinis]